MNHEHAQPSTLIAIVPAATLRRWDRIAHDQLCEAAARLAEENEQLLSRAQFAEESADMWQQINDRERDGYTVGLTQDCRVVVLDGPPNWSIDDDQEYRRSACQS